MGIAPVIVRVRQGPAAAISTDAAAARLTAIAKRSPPRSPSQGITTSPARHAPAMEPAVLIEYRRPTSRAGPGRFGETASASGKTAPIQNAGTKEMEPLTKACEARNHRG